MAEQNFYKAFEDRHRGSRELIKERLKVYIPFITPLKKIYSNCAAIDLGCGRGEWLELMRETGFIKSHGIDLDVDMLKAAQEQGLSVEKKDVLAYLRELPDQSQVLVTAFHLVEHIPFEAMQTLVKEAMRVLAPGGLLILETPNPENIVVATNNFYLDPSHRTPIPHQLMTFLTEYYGYARTKMVRLQSTYQQTETVTLLDVLSGTGQDYAVIAQKEIEEESLVYWGNIFEQQYGMSLEEIAQTFDARLSRLEEEVSQTTRLLNKMTKSSIWRIAAWVNSKFKNNNKGQIKG